MLCVTLYAHTHLWSVTLAPSVLPPFLSVSNWPHWFKEKWFPTYRTEQFRTGQKANYLLREELLGMLCSLKWTSYPYLSGGLSGKLQRGIYFRGQAVEQPFACIFSPQSSPTLLASWAQREGQRFPFSGERNCKHWKLLMVEISVAVCELSGD